MALAIAGPAAAQNGEQPAFAGPYVPTPWVIVDEMMKLANRNATEAGVADRVKFFERDLFTTDVREAGIVTLHTVPRSMAPRP